MGWRSPALSGQPGGEPTSHFGRTLTTKEDHSCHEGTGESAGVMTEWTLLKRLLDAVHQHSTMIGRLWLTVMVIFRLLIVAVATEDVYADEQEMFVCNTLQPGCSTVCYDAFAPISQPRFWVFHIISVSTPSLCFIIYTWHNLSKLPQNAAAQRSGPKVGVTPGHQGTREAYDRSCDSDSCSIRSHKHLGHSLADVLEGIAAAAAARSPRNLVSVGRPDVQGVSGGVLSKCYVVHVCFRAVLEVGFVLAQWKLFGFRVPVHFLCRSAPCSQPVDCYVSRPTEKTVFLLFMFCVGVFCVVLNLLELNHLGWKKIRQAVQRRDSVMNGGFDTFPPDSPSLASSSLGFRDVTGTTSLPTLDLVLGHRADWASEVGEVVEVREVVEVVEVGETPPDCGKAERKAPRAVRESRQRSAEVWI